MLEIKMQKGIIEIKDRFTTWWGMYETPNKFREMVKHVVEGEFVVSFMYKDPPNKDKIKMRIHPLIQGKMTPPVLESDWMGGERGRIRSYTYLPN